MGDGVKKSRRGVYYDLAISPYEFKTPYGDIFKFSSEKKRQMYIRDVEKEITRLKDCFKRNGLENHLPEELQRLIHRTVYQSFYEMRLR